MTVKRIENAWICSVHGTTVNPIFGDIVLENGEISAIVEKKFSDYLTRKQRPHKNAYNANGAVITIPLVNFHEHFYSRLAKGLNVKGETEDFYGILHNLWWKLDKILSPEMISASAKMGALESITNGVTYVFDHHASPMNAEGSLELIANVLLDFGMKGALCFETSDRDGNKIAQQGLAENVRFAESIDSDSIKAMLGLHASFTLSDDTLVESHRLQADFGLPIHIHLCEDAADRAMSREVTGAFPVDRLIKNNLLDEKSILAHGIYLTKKDLDNIDRSGAAVAFNPDSNMNNSVGTPDFAAYNEAIPMLLGTDGMHANPAKSLKNAFLLMRASDMSFDAAFHVISKIYSDQVTFVQRFFPEYPRLKKGDRADLVIWDYVPPTPLRKNNFFGHYVYGIAERSPKCVMMNGKFLMKDKTLSQIDEAEMGKEIFNEGEKLLKIFNQIK